ncbi:MAG: haloacid dehalogenase-like hydrolase [Planctomycetes bacterium]|nr:haloacid dehalogenase-like hydrolase [Planctomycetota bacterium]
MQNIAVVDFDRTILNVDSLKYILIKEKLYLDPMLFAFGALLFGNIAFNRTKQKQLFVRNLFKKRLLLLINRLDKRKFDKYVEYFKNHLNHDLLRILNENYSKIFIVSASEATLIENVVSLQLNTFAVIANNMKHLENFETCWGINKVKFLQHKAGDEISLAFDVFTDSLDDRPLIMMSNRAFLVNKTKVQEIDKNTLKCF